MTDGQMRVGVGFATGRKQFRRTLRSHIRDWVDSGLAADKRVSLNLFVAFDVGYMGTCRDDYTHIDPALAQQFDHISFIGRSEFCAMKERLVGKQHVMTTDDVDRAFGTGYAAMRNALVYEALRTEMDCLVFLDDDEYPFAALEQGGEMVWRVQHTLKAHINRIKDGDITCGLHCGCVSPIPHIVFNDVLGEDTFKLFIKAISNDIVDWQSVSSAIFHDGLTYADSSVLDRSASVEKTEHDHMKCISGSNLGINLTDPERIFPFFNPPEARGEDTFLGTCLARRKVLQVPCYTFHDAFSAYSEILDGVLPIRSKPVETNEGEVVVRFLRACIGWARYKPLLVFITDRDNYRNRISRASAALRSVLPSVCSYFHTDAFMQILDEFDRYDHLVFYHNHLFEQAKRAWGKLMATRAWSV